MQGLLPNQENLWLTGLLDARSEFIMRVRPWLAILALLLPISAFAAPQHAISMYGDPALPADFASLPYTNPDAPNGGTISFGILGTFDTFNAYTVRGIAAQGFGPPVGLVQQSLMMRSSDEPLTLYGALAQTIDVSDDRSLVTFHIDPDARFSDNQPVTAEDVSFSWALLKDKGKPAQRAYYSKVKGVTITDPLTITFDCSGAKERELPLILGLMPVFAMHATNAETFEQTSLTPPLGSGPYVVSDIKPGESVTYKRNPNFWGKSKSIFRGLYHPDIYRYEYYRDANTLFEAFKAGLYDVRIEDDPTRWATGYDFPRMTDGGAVKDAIPVRTPKGMTGLVFNTRKNIFVDARIREALTYMFDFEWTNKSLFSEIYRRTGSYFEGSELSSIGLPASPGERRLLAPFSDEVRSDVLQGQWRPPVSDGTGRDRKNARIALDLLRSAGLAIHNGVLTNLQGEPFKFEILVVTRVQERLALNFADSLAKLGIKVAVRLVDDVQYWHRVAGFDYDMIQFTWGASPSPGNEQVNRWGSKARDREGSLNYAGASSPAIDAALAAMLSAQSRDDWLDAIHALDRVLISGFYVVPLFNAPDQWIIRDAKVKRPQRAPLSGFAPETLWREDR
jgi:peptide/nickel transport system substrate-binding protein